MMAFNLIHPLSSVIPFASIPRAGGASSRCRQRRNTERRRRSQGLRGLPPEFLASFPFSAVLHTLFAMAVKPPPRPRNPNASSTLPTFSQVLEWPAAFAHSPQPSIASNSSISVRRRSSSQPGSTGQPEDPPYLYLINHLIRHRTPSGPHPI